MAGWERDPDDPEWEPKNNFTRVKLPNKEQIVVTSTMTTWTVIHVDTNNKFGLACSLDILFLRRDSPGNLVRSGGDIDNRINTLFDALRRPENGEEVAGFPPGPNEDPFFCLMETDSLVTEVSVITDRLLLPQAPYL
jgi:hypothetical protein